MTNLPSALRNLSDDIIARVTAQENDPTLRRRVFPKNQLVVVAPRETGELVNSGTEIWTELEYRRDYIGERALEENEKVVYAWIETPDCTELPPDDLECICQFTVDGSPLYEFEYRGHDVKMWVVPEDPELVCVSKFVKGPPGEKIPRGEPIPPLEKTSYADQFDFDSDHNPYMGYSNRVTPPPTYDFHTEGRWELVDGGTCARCGNDSDNNCYQEDQFEEDVDGHLLRYCYNCWELLAT